jgi:hypothetical protein
MEYSNNIYCLPTTSTRVKFHKDLMTEYYVDNFQFFESQEKPVPLNFENQKQKINQKVNFSK